MLCHKIQSNLAAIGGKRSPRVYVLYNQFSDFQESIQVLDSEKVFLSRSIRINRTRTGNLYNLNYVNVWSHSNHVNIDSHFFQFLGIGYGQMPIDIWSAVSYK